MNQIKHGVYFCFTKSRHEISEVKKTKIAVHNGDERRYTDKNKSPSWGYILPS